MKQPPIFVILDDDSTTPPRRSAPAPRYDKLPPIMRIAREPAYDAWLRTYAPKLHRKLWLIRLCCWALAWLFGYLILYL